MKTSELAYLEDTYKLIQSPLSDEPELMKKQLRERYGRVGYCYRLLAIANAELDNAEDAAGELIKDKPLKAYAFEAKVKAMCSAQRRIRNEFQGVIKTIEGEAMLGMSIIKDNRRLPVE
jgi:hypothetical protein